MCHSRENGNPGRTGSRIKCGVTGGAGIPAFFLSFPRKRESRPTGSPIRSALLSVEDNGREWIPHLPSVIPVKTGIHSEWIPHQVRDDGRGWHPRVFFVIPAKAGIQSEWIPNPKRFAFG